MLITTPSTEQIPTVRAVEALAGALEQSQSLADDVPADTRVRTVGNRHRGPGGLQDRPDPVFGKVLVAVIASATALGNPMASVAPDGVSAGWWGSREGNSPMSLRFVQSRTCPRTPLAVMVPDRPKKFRALRPPAL